MDSVESLKELPTRLVSHPRHVMQPDSLPYVEAKSTSVHVGTPQESL